MEVAAHEADAVERAPEGVGIELGEHLVAVDFLDDQRHDQHDCRADRPQGGHQRRGRGRTVEVDHPRAHREGIDHADGALVGVREGQHRKERVAAVDREDRGGDVDLRAERRMGQHHALGLRSGSRRVDDHGQVVGPGNARRAFPADALRDDAEVLGADRHVEPLDGLLRELGEKFVRHEQGLGLRMLDDHVQLLAREVGQDRHGHHARRRDGEIADAPVGHVAAQESHLVPGAKPRSGEDFLHPGDTTAHLGISHVIALVHRESDFRRELLHAVADQFVQCIDSHHVFFFSYVRITQKFGAKLLISG